MDKFKFVLFSGIAIFLMILIGFWAFRSLESGSAHVSNQKIKDLEKENFELKEQIDDLLAQVGELTPNVEENVVEEEIQEEKTENDTENISANKYQTLIDKLQKLIDNKFVFKKGIKGAQVGVVQEFLNVYNGTSNRIDNDYGEKTVTLIKDFEQDQKLIITEEIGPKTFQVMIDWLRKQ